MYDKKLYNLNSRMFCGDSYDYSINYKDYSYKLSDEAYMRISRSIKKIGIDKCIELEVKNIEFDILIYQVDNQLNLFTEEDFEYSIMFDKINTSQIEKNINFLYSKEELVENHFGKNYFSDINRFKKAVQYIHKFKQYLSSFISTKRKGGFKEFEIYYKEKMEEERMKQEKAESERFKNLDRSSVYLIKDSTLNRYKIGVSKEPEKRLLQLQTANSNKLNLVCKTYPLHYAFKLEKEWHNLFNDYRIQSEWFLLGEEHIEDLIRRMEYYTTIEMFEEEMRNSDLEGDEHFKLELQLRKKYFPNEN